MPYKDINEQREFQRLWRANQVSNNTDYSKRQKASLKERKDRLKNYVKEIKQSSSCVFCGKRNNLEFHHKDRKTKTYSIAQIISGKYSIEILKLELDKCIILCNACHNKYHTLSGHFNNSTEESTKKRLATRKEREERGLYIESYKRGWEVSRKRKEEGLFK